MNYPALGHGPEIVREAVQTSLAAAVGLSLWLVEMSSEARGREEGIDEPRGVAGRTSLGFRGSTTVAGATGAAGDDSGHCDGDARS